MIREPKGGDGVENIRTLADVAMDKLKAASAAAKERATPEYLQELAERAEKDRRAEKQQKIERSGIGPRFFFSRFETYAPQNDLEKNIKSFLVSFAADPKNKTVLLSGNKGTGKTALAAACIYETQGRALYVSMRDICLDIRVSRSFKADKNEKSIYTDYSGAEFLVIDEIGRGDNIDMEKSFLSYVINKRYESMKPTLLITNLNEKGLAAFLPDDSKDRINETGVLLPFNSTESYRKNTN